MSRKESFFFDADVDKDATEALSKQLSPADLVSFNLLSGDQVCSESFPIDVSRAVPIWKSDYVVPSVPANLPSTFEPAANTRLADLLKRGQNRLDLKKHYLATHRDGWGAAVKDWREHKEFRIQSEQDAIKHQEDVPSGSRAFWLGYSAARQTLETRLENLSGH